MEPELDTFVSNDHSAYYQPTQADWEEYFAYLATLPHLAPELQPGPLPTESIMGSVSNEDIDILKDCPF